MANARKPTPEELAAIEAAAAMPDGEIDTTDAPEVTDWSRARRGMLTRPVKLPVTMRLDADLLEWFRADDARGYQTRINAALRDYVERHKA